MFVDAKGEVVLTDADKTQMTVGLGHPFTHPIWDVVTERFSVTAIYYLRPNQSLDVPNPVIPCLIVRIDAAETVIGATLVR